MAGCLTAEAEPTRACWADPGALTRRCAAGAAAQGVALQLREEPGGGRQRRLQQRALRRAGAAVRARSQHGHRQLALTPGLGWSQVGLGARPPDSTMLLNVGHVSLEKAEHLVSWRPCLCITPMILMLRGDLQVADACMLLKQLVCLTRPTWKRQSLLGAVHHLHHWQTCSLSAFDHPPDTSEKAARHQEPAVENEYALRRMEAAFV